MVILHEMHMYREGSRTALLHANLGSVWLQRFGKKKQRTVPGTHGCNINTNSIKTKHATSQSSEVAIFIYGAKKY